MLVVSVEEPVELPVALGSLEVLGVVAEPVPVASVLEAPEVVPVAELVSVALPVPLMLPVEPVVAGGDDVLVSFMSVLLRVASRLQPAKPRARAARVATRVSFGR